MNVGPPLKRDRHSFKSLSVWKELAGVVTNRLMPKFSIILRRLFFIFSSGSFGTSLWGYRVVVI